MRVCVMADYCASGLWAEEGYELDIDELGLPRAIVDQLAAMAVGYDTKSMIWDIALYEAMTDLEHLKADITEEVFSVWAWEIGVAIKEEFPEWDVWFYNDVSGDGAPAIDLPVVNHRSRILGLEPVVSEPVSVD